jgi:hypothetical protein
MTGRTRTIRRALAAISLSAAAALFVIPLAQAQDTILDVSARDGRVQAQQPNVAGDYMFRDFLRNANRTAVSSPEPQVHPSQGGGPAVGTQARDNILDVSARDDRVQVSSGKPDLTGDYMFRQYFQQASRASDHILDVSARDAGIAAVNDHILDVSARPLPATPTVSESTGGTDWRKIGIGVAVGMGGALLLGALVVAGLEVRHHRHRLGSA